jgi:hypothetical protein
MTVLLPPLQPGSQFKTVEIAPDVLIEIQVTKPTYLQVCADRSIVDNTEANLARMECVTGWKGVVRMREDGLTEPVLFSKDALAELFVAFPRSFHAIWEAVSTLYRTAPKNLPTPASESPAGEPPKNCIGNSEPSAT